MDSNFSELVGKYTVDLFHIYGRNHPYNLIVLNILIIIATGEVASKTSIHVLRAVRQCLWSLQHPTSTLLHGKWVQ